ncbi:hypothetical protein IFR05_016770 [Cadophora sp. M221]|nr:hypothetical protein IFR05_016770 [Cadophora sp. M221]
MKNSVSVIGELANDHEYIRHKRRMPGAFPDFSRHEGSGISYDDTSLSSAEHHPPPETAAYKTSHQGPLVNTGSDLEGNPILPDLHELGSDPPLSPQKLDSASKASLRGRKSKRARCSGNRCQIFRDQIRRLLSQDQRYCSDENLDMQCQEDSGDSDLDSSTQQPSKSCGSESETNVRTKRTGMKTVEEATKRSVEKPIGAHHRGEMLDPEKPPPYNPASAKAEPPVVNPLPRASSVHSCSISASGKSTSPDLSGTKVRSHNAQVHPLEQQRAKLQRVNDYMKMVLVDETTRSVAASVISTKTQRSSKSWFCGILRCQDKFFNYLGKHTKNANPDLVQELLRAGCDTGTKRRSRWIRPIFNVIRGASPRHTKCLRLLLDHGVDVNVRSKYTHKTPLQEVIEQKVWSGYSTVIFLLLKAGADPNAKDRHGDIALLKLLKHSKHPLKEDHRRALALLLTFGANVNVTRPGTRSRSNPLHHAIRRNDPWAVDMLLTRIDSARDIEAENSKGLTPLLLAASHWQQPQTMTMTEDQLWILESLLENGADVNAKMPMKKQTPLHIAIGYRLVRAVEVLMLHGANPNVETNEGKTAWDVAREKRELDRCG